MQSTKKKLTEFIFALAVCAAAIRPIHAGTLTVTSSADNGAGTLRALVSQAVSGDTIIFGTGLAGQTIMLSGGQLTVTNNLTIDASALAGGVAISGNNASRVLLVNSNATLTLRSLTLINGQVSADSGGGIRNEGNLTAFNCIFSNNAALGGNGVNPGGGNNGGPGGGGAGLGGAIYSEGAALTLGGCTFQGNLAQGGTGGAGNNSGGLSNFNGGNGGGPNGGSGGDAYDFFSPGGNPGGFGGGGGGGSAEIGPFGIEDGFNGGSGGFGGGGGGGAAGDDGVGVNGNAGGGGAAGAFGGAGGAALSFVTGGGGGGAGLGGGVFVLGGAVTVTNCSFTGNVANEGVGGAGFSSGGNGANGLGLGGGLFNNSTNLALINNIFSGNQASTGSPNEYPMLGATAILVGPSGGINSVVLAALNLTWTASANAAWLHLDDGRQSGAGSTNVVFTFDPNPGPTRTGTLTVAGQTLTITQAGSTYIAAAAAPTQLASRISPLYYPTGVAVDSAGNVYIADEDVNTVKKWTLTNNTVSDLVSGGLNNPFGIAADGAGNVYIADTDNNAIKEWTVANGNVSTLVSSGLAGPEGVAVNASGNVFIADTMNSMIREWAVYSGGTSPLAASGFNYPRGVAVDVAGNVYVADTVNDSIESVTPATGAVTTIVGSDSGYPLGVAVDGSGNVYFTDSAQAAVKKWTAASNVVTTLVASGLNSPWGVAVDASGNVYFADSEGLAVSELPYAFVDPTLRIEGPEAGGDALPVVLPATVNLRPPFAPASDQPWLTITSVTNGVVSFAFAVNDTGSNRTANLTVLGQRVPVTQTPAALGSAALLEGPAAGSDSVVLSIPGLSLAWTAEAGAPWLHLNAANQSGTGSTNVVFTFDANPGPTRSGALTVAGLTLTVTQAGSAYVAAPGPVTPLPGSNLVRPSGVAVDSAGNVYVADDYNNVIEMWSPASNTATTLVASGLNQPFGVAVDRWGNVYIADSGDNAIKEWTASGKSLITLVSSGLNDPVAVAVDGAGNVYIADSGDNAIREWIAASNSLTNLVSSGLTSPQGLAVDVAGNVYIADSGDSQIKERLAASGNVTTLVSAGLNNPFGVAVDGSGNVLIGDTFNNAIKKWSAVSNTVTTLVSSGLHYPAAVAVDGAGNLYLADFANSAVKERPRAFVDPTARTEGLSAGSDALPVVLPATTNLLPPFAPSSDQPWLTITDVNEGVVSFAFVTNSTGANRVAEITVLGQSVAITQATDVTPPAIDGETFLAPGEFQLSFSDNAADASFTVLASTNLALPLSQWTVLGAATNLGAGRWQFIDIQATNRQCFYSIRSP